MNIFQKGDVNNFIQQSSSDKDFLQSEEWRKFQESVGHKTFTISSDNFQANIIEHKLPIVGRYFYIPRGPILTHNTQHTTHNIGKLINLAKENKAGWVRIEPNNQKILKIIQGFPPKADRKIQGFGLEIRKAPHDMQARQVFVIDITKNEEELLAQMKAKTRYNIRLAQRKGVSLRITNSYETTNNKKNRNVEEFLRLVKITSRRNEIKSHPENYYRKMLGNIPAKNLKLYAAEYEGKIIAANLVSFYGSTATYLHGASDNEYRNVMAPFLLQWRTMLDAKKTGCERYDLGGVFTNYESDTNILITNKSKLQATPKSCATGQASHKLQADWAGITRFKLGFSPKTKPVEFPGSYDIVISPWRYWVYRMLQKIKSIL